MENIKCKTCGGSVTRSGNYYVCEWCRNKWEVDQANDVHAVERANAWEALRNGDFEKASEMFENIIVKDNKNHEAYWGRALALSGIIYVTDMSESKKVPTCNNITEESFIGSKDVQKAISLAPADIADNYRKQAEYIEKVRVEWLEKASKEPAYDVFISFKDSDRENGIERTQDSVDAQDLYNALVADGYKVFFSRISLRDKISEQYEPYIYNAIKTAKVMIVFGEKAEYFSSVWIKNEWSRFKTRIEKGEKHKNSLVVVYKNMNPGDLPTVLKSRQCLNASDMTFLPSLNKHIKRVIDESKQALHLEKITVKSGEISKKATKIENESIQVREIGAGAIAEVSISEKQQMDLAKTYLKMSQWREAEKIVDDVLFNNPNNPDALLAKLMLRNQCSELNYLAKAAKSFTDEDYGLIEKTLNCASKDMASKILNVLYSADEIVDEHTYAKILKTILPYQFNERSKRIEEDFETAITKSRFEVFNILLGTLASDEVDRYINYHLEFERMVRKNLRRSDSWEYSEKCLKAVLAVDSGNIEALERLFDLMWVYSSVEERIKYFEEMLKYSKDIDECTLWALNYARSRIDEVPDADDAEFVIKVLKYYTKPLSTIKDDLISTASAMLLCDEYSEQVEYILGLILTFAPDDPEVYWMICLLKTKSHDEKSLIDSPIFLKDIPEYTKYLALVDEQRRLQCINLASEQVENFKYKKNRELSAAKKRKKTRIAIAISSVLLAAIIVVILSVTVFIPQNNYKKAEQYFAEGNYLEAYKYYDKANGWGDSRSKMSGISEKAPDETEKLAAEGKYLEAYNYLSTAGSYSARTLEEGYLAAVQGKYFEAAEKGVPHIILPEGTTQIPDSAFSSCSKLKSVIIPNSVTSIGERAFSKCGLKSITIPNSVTSIGDYAFYNCENLASITIPNSVTSIGDYAFYNCDSLTSVTIPDSVTSIGKRTFYDCESLASITIGNGVTSIGEEAFYSCDSLTSVTIPNSVTSIGDDAFYGCKSLTSVTIPDSVTSIGKRTFYNCKNLASITIGNGVTSIGDDAFYSCDSLTSVTIPDSVTSIGMRAFYNCENLASITIGNGVTSIGGQTFSGCTAITNMTIPFVGSTKDATGYKSAFGYIFGYTGSRYSSSGYHYYDGDEKYYYTYSIPTTLKYVTVNGGKILSYSFRNCTTLETIVIGENVSTISTNAFEGCTKLTNAIVSKEYDSTFPPVIKYGIAVQKINLGEYDSAHEIFTEIGTYRDSSVKANAALCLKNSTKNNYDALIKDLLSAGETITVNYDLNGGVMNDATSIKLTPSNSFNGFANPTNKNYIFLGWDLIDVKYISDGSLSFSLKAGWLDGYKITYELDGGFADNPIAYNKASGDIILYAPTKEGYRFTGWIGTGLDTPTLNVTIPSGSDGDRAYTATWAIETYTVTYILNGGSLPTSAKTSFTVNDLPFSLPSCSKINYAFLGWKINDYSGESISQITECTNITVYAQYIDVNLQLKLSGSNYIVSKYSGTSQFVEIPSEYNGIPIVEISSSAFYNNKTVKTITIPSTVTKIGSSAFEGCTSLTHINIPNGVTSISTSLFEGCTSLESITIPDTVSYIASSAFEDCSSLQTLVLPQSLTAIGNYAFGNCSSLYSIDIPAGVTKIDYCTFAKCDNLTEVTLREGLKEITFGAFGTPSLKYLVIPSSVTSIHNEAFNYSSNGNCSSVVFLCKAKIMPGGWESGWNNSRPVIWGYDEETYEFPTYNFVTNGGTELESLNQISISAAPISTKDGFVLFGWYDNAQFSGSPVSFPYYSTDKTTLYARWMPYSEYYDGSSVDRPIMINSNTFSVSLNAKEEKYYAFKVSGSGTYQIRSSSGALGYCYLYDAYGSQLTYTYNVLSSSYIGIIHTLWDGKTYVLKIKPNYSSNLSTTFYIGLN